MRVGCGIWGSWYGYSGGGAEADQLWVDKATGMVLREEGFAKGKCRFTVEYGDFQPVPAGGSAPGRVLVTLLGSGEPWIFDMRFAVVNNAAWLLSSLTESSGGRERVVVAETSDAIAERAD
jgi:hypothetical protein